MMNLANFACLLWSLFLSLIVFFLVSASSLVITSAVLINLLLFLFACGALIDFNNERIRIMLSWSFCSKFFEVSESEVNLSTASLILMWVCFLLPLVLISFKAYYYEVILAFSIVFAFYLYRLIIFSYFINYWGEKVFRAGLLTFFWIVLALEIIKFEKPDVSGILIVFAGSFEICLLLAMVIQVFHVEKIVTYVNCISIVVNTLGAMGLLYDGILNNSVEKVAFSVFYATSLPIIIFFLRFYFALDLGYKHKTGGFLCILTLVFTACMSVTGDIYISYSSAFGDLITYFFPLFAAYCTLASSLVTIAKYKGYNLINSIIVMLLFIPMAVVFPLNAAGIISDLIFFLTFIIPLIILGLTLLYIIKILYRNRVEIMTNINACNTLEGELLTLIWKLWYIVAITVISRRLYFTNYQDSNSTFILSEVLIATTVIMIFSLAIENADFYIKETGHIEPSVKRLIWITKMPASNKQLIKSKCLGQFYKFFLACLIALSAISILPVIKDGILCVYPLLASFVVCYISMVVIYIKFRLWGHGDYAANITQVFMWSVFYLPVICFTPVYMTADSLNSAVRSWIYALIAFPIFFFIGLASFIMSKNLEKNVILSNKQLVLRYLKIIFPKITNEIIDYIIEDVQKNRRTPFEFNNNGVYPQIHKGICASCNRGEKHEVEIHENTKSLQKLINKLKFKIEIIQNNPVAVQNEGPRITRNLTMQSRVLNNTVAVQNEGRGLIRNLTMQNPVPNENPNGNQFTISHSELRNFHRFFKGSKIDDRNFINKIHNCRYFDRKFSQDEINIVYTNVCVDARQQNSDVHQNRTNEINANFALSILKILALYLFSNRSQYTIEYVYKSIFYKRIDLSKIIESPGQFALKVIDKISSLLEKLIPTDRRLFESFFAQNDTHLVKIIKLVEGDKIDLGECYNAVAMFFPNFSIDSFTSVYSLCAIALSQDVNWLDSHINFSFLVLPSNYGWLAYLCTYYAIIFIFIICMYFCYRKLGLDTENFLHNPNSVHENNDESRNEGESRNRDISILIHRNQEVQRVNHSRCQGFLEWLKGLAYYLVFQFTRFVGTHLFMDVLIRLLGALYCEHSELGDYVFNNPEIECWGTTHMPLFIFSLVLILIYYVLSSTFNAILEEREQKFFFFFDRQARMLFVVFVVFFPQQDFLLLKLAACINISACLMLWKIKKFRMEDNYLKKLKEIGEYLVTIWINMWAIVNYTTSQKILSFTMVILSVFISYFIWICIQIHRFLNRHK